jgi:hypothetical protein
LFSSRSHGCLAFLLNFNQSSHYFLLCQYFEKQINLAIIFDFVNIFEKQINLAIIFDFVDILKTFLFQKIFSRN